MSTGPSLCYDRYVSYDFPKIKFCLMQISSGSWFKDILNENRCMGEIDPVCSPRVKSKKICFIQGEAHEVLQSDSTQTIDHIQKCFRQKFQCSRRPSYWTTLFFYRWMQISSGSILTLKISEDIRQNWIFGKS